MKKLSTFVLLLAIMTFAVGGGTAFAGCGDGPLDKAWDWATTLGKEGLEKQKVLAENKAERLKKCAEKEAKKAGKKMEKAGEDAKKKLGF